MRRLFIAAALLAALLVPTQAFAGLHHPKGEYAQFKACPLEHPELTFCIFSESSSGFFTIGKKTVPLKVPQILQGGFLFHEDGSTTFVGAEGAETLV